MYTNFYRTLLQALIKLTQHKSCLRLSFPSWSLVHTYLPNEYMHKESPKGLFSCSFFQQTLHLVWLNLYGREAVRHKLKSRQKMHFLCFQAVFELMSDSLRFFLLSRPFRFFFQKKKKMLHLNENKQPVHMRYHLFLHYGWFLQNLGKDFIRTNMHTTVYTMKLSVK